MTKGDAITARPDGFDRDAAGHFPSLQRAARHLTRDVSEAEDLVQETYVRAMRGSAHFRWGTDLKAWLLTILRHVHLNRRRTVARAIVEFDQEKVDRLAELAEHSDTPERRLMRTVLDGDMRAAMNSLPLALRQTLWLREAEELSYAQIANRLRIPVGTVMSRLSRARRLLYARLKR
jgi:RNA polymerase sigma-70 factor, ECF subfamily